MRPLFSQQLRLQEHGVAHCRALHPLEELSMTPLRQRMIEDMQARNLAPRTQTAYLRYVEQFARHFHKSPELLGPTEIHAFQLHLARERKLAAGSIRVAVAAIRFLYNTCRSSRAIFVSHRNCSAQPRSAPSSFIWPETKSLPPVRSVWRSPPFAFSTMSRCSADGTSMTSSQPAAGHKRFRSS